MNDSKFNLQHEDIEILNNIQFKMFKDELDDDENDEEESASASSSYLAYTKDDGELLTPETILNSKALYRAQTYKDFEVYVLNNVKNNERFKTSKKISYDIETNAESPFSEKADIVGFSISFSPDSGIYVVRDSLDYKMTDEDWQKSTNLLIALFKISEKVLVHNMEYEVPYTINCLNYELKNEHLDDTMVKCRILYPGEPAGLKPASARLLGYQDWDIELSNYTKAMKKIISEFSKLSIAKRANLESRVSDLNLYNKFTDAGRYSSINPKKLYEEILTGKYIATDLTTAFISIFQILLLNDILDTETFDLIKNAIIEIVLDGGLKTSVIPYSLIPMKVIAKYGAIDAVATYELDDHCNTQFPIKSEHIRTLLRNLTNDTTFDFFDFRKGYENVKAQFDAGINLQLAGAYWDDNLAQQELEYYQTQLTHSWLNLFKNDKFKAHVKKDYEPTLLKELISNAVADLRANHDSEHAKKLHAILSTFGRYTLQATQIKFLDKIVDEGLVGKPLTVRVSNLNEYFYDELKTQFSDDLDSLFYKMISDIINDGAESLSKIYNPMSTKKDHAEIVDKLLNTETLKYGTLYVACYKQLQENRFWERYPVDEKSKPIIDLFTFLERVKNHNENLAADSVAMPQAQVFKAFVQLFNKIDVQSSAEMLSIFMEAMGFTIEKLSDTFLIDVYHKFKATGIDIEKPETWSQEFNWLYNFRVYKKSNKMITTYINGKVGRKSLFVINKDENTNLLARRKRLYAHDTPHDSDLEQLLLAATFSICGADTGRWRAGIHTIPAGSTVKNIYRSRFEGGVICAPDYSQMEVRAIAASAKEDIMLNVFKNGEDIHLKTASYVWKKPESEITDAERRFSKAVTFAVLYGATEKNIADSMLGGDYQAAKEIMDGFYKGYPKLKAWVDAMHSLYNQINAVPLASSRIINIRLPSKDDPKYKYAKSKGFRQAQNYPIQGLSNDIAGYALYLVINYIKENQLKSKAISFVHDALYFDIHPHELFSVSSEIDTIMNEYPKQAFDLPAVADLVIGVSMGQELRVEEMHKVSDTEGYFILSGYLDDFDALIENWKNVYTDVQWESAGKEKISYVKTEDLFIPKRAISKYLGTARTVIKRKVSIKF